MILNSYIIQKQAAREKLAADMAAWEAKHGPARQVDPAASSGAPFGKAITGDVEMARQRGTRRSKIVRGCA